jgi:signal transduction histidine kinase
VLNYGVILLDAGFPYGGTPDANVGAIGAATCFFAYAVSALLLVGKRRVSLDTYFVVTPVLDVLLSAVLIMTTEGYLSPFNLWLVFSVLAAGINRYRAMPLVSTILGIVAHTLIATIPQKLPLDPSVFAVRTGYLFGFAIILSFLSSSLSWQSKALVSIEEAGAAFASVMDLDQVGRVLIQSVKSIPGFVFASLSVPDAEPVTERDPDAQPPRHINEWVLMNAGLEVGKLRVEWSRALNRQEESLVRVLCDRAASAMARAKLAGQLVKAAAAEERSRVADELHDSYIQSLAAIDLRSEAIRKLLRDRIPEIEAELEEVKKIARRAAAEARQVLHIEGMSGDTGPGELERLISSRWHGTWDLEVPSSLDLSEEEWRAILMLVKEGLHNASKHGRANHVRFSLKPNNGQMVARLEQFGRGLETGARFGYGLTRLKSLFGELGGNLSLNNIHPSGTVLEASFMRRHAEDSNADN